MLFWVQGACLRIKMIPNSRRMHWRKRELQRQKLQNMGSNTTVEKSEVLQDWALYFDSGQWFKMQNKPPNQWRKKFRWYPVQKISSHIEFIHFFAWKNGLALFHILRGSRSCWTFLGEAQAVEPFSWGGASRRTILAARQSHSIYHTRGGLHPPHPPCSAPAPNQ